MDIVDKLKKGITFPKKIKYLRMIILFSLIGVFLIDKLQIGGIRAIAIGLISVAVLFQVTAMLTGVLSRLKEASEDLKQKLIERIKESINKELKAKDTKEKLKYYYDRSSLYSLSGMMSVEGFRIAILGAFFFLIASVIISFFEFDTFFTVTQTIEEKKYMIWQLSSWHIVYILLMVGIYFIGKLVLFYDEMIRKGEILKEEEEKILF